MKSDRKTKILDILIAENRVEVAKLSNRLGVSQVTVRKDLDELEQSHMIRRVHGFAELRSADDVSGRLAYHYEAKTKIAQAAAGLVRDGDTVMIESGSCCALAALLIAQARRDVTIVTNSAFVADYIRGRRSVQVVLLGGIYQQDSQCLVGPMVRDGAASYHVKYFFIGTDGWSPRTGFTNKDQLRAQAVRDMAASAENIVVLTESEKFSTVGTVPLNIKDQPKLLITDDRLPANARDFLAEKGIEAVTCG